MSFIFSLLTTLVAILVYFSSSRLEDRRTVWIVRGVSALIGAIALFSSITRVFVIVPPGNVGTVNVFGKVANNALEPGIHVMNPFANILYFSTRLKDVKENVDATSQEGLALNIDVSLQYKLDPRKAPEVYKNIGTDEKQLVISRFRSIARAITAQYPAMEIYSSKRQEIAQKIEQQLTEYLSSLGFIVEDILLRNVKMPESLQTAIQEKLQAEQESQKMKFVLEKEQKEAERKKIEAQGIAESQKIISSGLTNQILQLRAIEATQKLATSPNSKVVVVGGGQAGTPIFISPDNNRGN